MTQSTWWTCIDHTNGLLPVGSIVMATTPYLEVMGEYGYGVLNETTREKDLDVFRMENVDKAYRVCVTTPKKKFNSKKDEENFNLF